jgi:HEAT repeat protein
MRRAALFFLAFLAGLLGLAATPALFAYVDRAPTLGAVVREADTIAVVEIDRFSAEKGAVILKKVRTLKGELGDGPIKHQLIGAADPAMDRTILDWAEPGRRGILFISANVGLVCMGQGWYQVSIDKDRKSAGPDDWWRLGAARPDLPLAYYGSVSRLAGAVELMLAGGTAIVTTLPHGNQEGAASFDLALNRTALPGLAKVQRIRANLRMPGVIMAVSANPAYLVGSGPVGEEELPALRAQLHSADATVRAESAMDLGAIGAKAVSAADDLAKLLDDPTPLVRFAAAAAYLRVCPGSSTASNTSLAVLTKGLHDNNPVMRRQAARAAGLAGAAAAPLGGRLGALLSDSDVAVRRSALQAIATLGPAAAGAFDAVVPLLENKETAIDAADALGRLGTTARPALKRLARMLESSSSDERWAAVRAMSQIGGEEAKPAVEFIIREIPHVRELEGYHLMFYLALLGPVAKEALPVLNRSRIINPFLRQLTAWAIEPSTDFRAAGFMGGPAEWIFDSYVTELGERLRPVAKDLAMQIMDGSTRDVPACGYKLLARFPDDTIPIFQTGLRAKDLVLRERAAVALGYMGSGAGTAQESVRLALAAAAGEKEQRLLKWCLREIAEQR